MAYRKLNALTLAAKAMLRTICVTDLLINESIVTTESS